MKHATNGDVPTLENKKSPSQRRVIVGRVLSADYADWEMTVGWGPRPRRVERHEKFGAFYPPPNCLESYTEQLV